MQRHRLIIDGTIIAIMALLVLGGLIALGFLRDVPGKTGRLLLRFSASA